MSRFWTNKDITTASGVTIRETQEDVPKFERVYTARLDYDASMKITMKMFLGSLFTTGELTQPNGRWVLFEPKRPADKILDPRLLPLVAQYVGEIFARDKEFRTSGPDEYTDKSGAKWVRSK